MSVVNSSIWTALSKRTQREYSVSIGILLRVITIREMHCLNSSSVRFLAPVCTHEREFTAVSHIPCARRALGSTHDHALCAAPPRRPGALSAPASRRDFFCP